jgi:AraC-like DNA-binding protein
MHIDSDCPGAIAVHRPRSADRVMWITADRVFYVGLLGMPSTRSVGAISLYVALESPVRISVDGAEWQTGNVAVVQPYTSHRVACDARHIAVIHVEPESVDAANLPMLLQHASGLVDWDSLRARVLSAHELLIRSGRRADAPIFDFDQLVFGHSLPIRSVDPRIARVLDRIRSDPSSQALAQDCAEQVHLSFSRFLHLFKSEVGASFRSFRTWKRARSLLHYVVDQRSTLTDVALGAGYPDSTHFSHSIRQVYGLKPKDIFAGSRKLRVIGPGLFA